MNFKKIPFEFIAVICLVTVLINGCTVKTLYNQLDWLIADRLQSYVELDEDQQELLNANLQQTLLWHRSTQLPLYAKWLQSFKADMLGRPTVKNVGQHLDQFQLFLHTVRVHSAGQIAELLPLLSAEQRQQVYRKMEDENVNFSEKFIEIDREEQIEAYAERMEDRMNDWLGSVNEKQEMLIAGSAKKIQTVASEVLQSRKRWQAAFKNILENNKNPKLIRASLQDLLVNIEKQRSANYKRIFASNRQVLINLIIDVAKTMDADQRLHLTEKVDDYSISFSEMAREANQSLPEHSL